MKFRNRRAERKAIGDFVVEVGRVVVAEPSRSKKALQERELILQVDGEVVPCIVVGGEIRLFPLLLEAKRAEMVLDHAHLVLPIERIEVAVNLGVKARERNWRDRKDKGRGLRVALVPAELTRERLHPATVEQTQFWRKTGEQLLGVDVVIVFISSRKAIEIGPGVAKAEHAVE